MSNQLITNSKSELLEFVDNLNITDGTYGNYDIILNLINSADNALFTKIIEEIKDGNLVFSDFTSWLGTDEFFNQSVESQEKLFMEHQMLRSYQIEKDAELAEYAEKLDVDSQVVMQDPKFKQLITTYSNSEDHYSAVDIEKENAIFALLNKPSNNSLEEVYKERMLKKILASDNTEFIDALLLSIHDYMVPVDFNHIQLNNYDKIFMKENSMTEDEMKKMKSFAAFLSTYFEE